MGRGVMHDYIIVHRVQVLDPLEFELQLVDEMPDMVLGITQCFWEIIHALKIEPPLQPLYTQYFLWLLRFPLSRISLHSLSAYKTMIGL